MKKLNYNWKLKGAKFTGKSGKVFSCFSGGGGSSMGYKLAGFDVIGCNEVDERLMMIYLKNNWCEYAYHEPIQQLLRRDVLPAELFQLDILDGSPPCSSFTYSGNREKDWGKEKSYKEGRVNQVLDMLFFDFIKLAERLQPKVVVAENVKALVEGAAKKYVVKIRERFEKAGYVVQQFVFNASKMGVPQSRERVFFIALRKDLVDPFVKQVDMFTAVPDISFRFNDAPIPYSQIRTPYGRELTTHQRVLWNKRRDGDAGFSDVNYREHGNKNDFNSKFLYLDKVLPTITAEGSYVDCDRPQKISDVSIVLASSFPVDFDFMSKSVQQVCGISVPPLMMAKIAKEIYKQWLSKIN